MVATYQQLSRGARSQWTPVRVRLNLAPRKPERLEQPNLPLTVERMLREESPPSCPRDGFRSPTSTFLQWWTKVPKFCSHDYKMGDGIEKVLLPGKWSSFPKSWPGLEAPRRWRGLLFYKDIFLLGQFIVLLLLSYFVNSALRPLSDFVSLR